MSRRTFYAPLVASSLFLAFVVYDLVRRNQNVDVRAFLPELLTAGEAIPLLVLSLTPLVAREYSRLTRPTSLNYDSRWVYRAERLPRQSWRRQRFRQVVLFARGGGTLWFESAQWHVECAGGEASVCDSLEELWDVLAAHGLREGVHYWVKNLSAEYPLPAAEQGEVFFECGERMAHLLSTFWVQVTYATSSRDLYTKPVVLLSAQRVSDSALATA